MNLDNFPFNELLEEEKRDRKLSLFKKLMLFMYSKKSEEIDNKEILTGIKKIVDVYQSLGELEGYYIVNLVSEHRPRKHDDWRLSFRDSGVEAIIMEIKVQNNSVRMEVRNANGVFISTDLYAKMTDIDGMSELECYKNYTNLN